MAEDAFARSQQKLPPRGRPAPAPPEERVTILCTCGVVMTLAWRTTEPVKCFGCDRVFSPPPTVTEAPLRWRPELAHRDAPPFRAIALAASIGVLLLLLLGLALRIALAHP